MQFFSKIFMSTIVSNMKRNVPLVESIRLPNLIMTNFILMPRTTLRDCSIKTCKFRWDRRISGKQRKMEPEKYENTELHKGFYWLKLSDELGYVPTEEDVAHYLRVTCWPSDGITEGTRAFFIGKQPVELGPKNCPFERSHELTKDYTTGPNDYRVVSYNILADTYADSDYSREVLFGHCPSHFLDIEYRRQLLMKEILGYHADLICLQEVDKKEYLKSYEPFMNLFGKHLSIYNTKGGDVREGQATFFRNDKFDLVESHRTLLTDLIDDTCKLEGDSDKLKAEVTNHPILKDSKSDQAKKCFAKFDAIRSVILSNQKLKTRFFERHTIIQTTLLKVKEFKNRYIVVANTHLYFAPDADHIRLLQGIVCVKYLEFIKKFYRNMVKSSDDSEPDVTIIFCGDMNSTPDCGLYKLLTSGHADQNLPDWSSNKEEAVEGFSADTHLRFKSAYENVSYTNYTREFNGCLDYIYYECDNLSCESTIPLPTHEEVTAMEGLPSNVFPSDHLALIANLKQTSSSE